MLQQLPMKQTSSFAADNPPISQTLCVAEAQRRILEQIEALREPERVPLREALARILYDGIATPRDMPPYDNAAMDGYAVAFDHLSPHGETTLRVAGSAFAGRPFEQAFSAGEALRIMTGAALPDGADTVVMQEAVRRDGDSVVIPAGQRRGQHVRRRGEEMRSGDVALAAGKRCGAAELGVIASLGMAEVTVFRRPRVAFFSSGDELASPGAALPPGRIYDSNRYTLYGALACLGCDVIDMGTLRDDPGTLRTVLLEAARDADAIVTSGGISTGEADFVRTLLADMGNVEFWRLEMKPGRPMAFGKIGKSWIFGLPGNPVATLVAFYQIVRAPLLKLAGLSPLPEPLLLSATSLSGIEKSPGRREFVRGHYTAAGGAIQVTPSGAQGSGMLTSLSNANCFIVLPEQQGPVEAGETVLIQPFDGLI